MANSKPKSPNNDFWSRLVWSTTDEFVAPHSMDECIKRLYALDQKYHAEKDSIWFITSPHYKLGQFERNDGTFRFEASGTMSRLMLDTKSVGQLNDINSYQTQVKIVTGYTTSSFRWFIAFIFLFPIAAILLVTRPKTEPEFLASLIIISAMTIFLAIILLLTQLPFAITIKAELRYSLYKSLSSPVVNRPSTLPP